MATVRLMEFLLTFGMYSIGRVCLGYIPQMAFETRDGMMVTMIYLTQMVNTRNRRKDS